MTKSYYDKDGNFIIESEYGHKIIISHFLFERYSNKDIKVSIPLSSYNFRVGLSHDAVDYYINGIKGYGAEWCE